MRVEEEVAQPAHEPQVARSMRQRLSPLRLLVFCAPAQFDGFVRAVSEPALAAELPLRGRPFDPDEFAATAAEYGIELLDPPGTPPQD